MIDLIAIHSRQAHDAGLAKRDCGWKPTGGEVMQLLEDRFRLLYEVDRLERNEKADEQHIIWLKKKVATLEALVWEGKKLANTRDEALSLKPSLGDWNAKVNAALGKKSKTHQPHCRAPQGFVCACVPPGSIKETSFS